jgi:guanylate kinase
VIETRLAEARTELRKLELYKYALVNDVLDQAASEMRAIVLAERGEANAGDAELAGRCLATAHSARLDSALGSFGVTVAGV